MFHRLPSGDPTQRKPDISLDGTALDLEPGVNLEQGLSKMTAYFRSTIRDAGIVIETVTKGCDERD